MGKGNKPKKTTHPQKPQKNKCSKYSEQFDLRGLGKEGRKNGARENDGMKREMKVKKKYLNKKRGG